MPVLEPGADPRVAGDVLERVLRPDPWLRLTMVSSSASGQGEFDRDRPCRAPGAEDRDSLAGRWRHLLERAEEALAVRVLTDETSVRVADDAVHSSDQAGRLAQPVQVLDHRDLVGQGAVESGPAHCAGACYCCRQPVRWHFAVHVAPVKPVMPEGRFDHLDGRVLGRRVGEGSDDLGEEVHRRMSVQRPLLPKLRQLSLGAVGDLEMPAHRLDEPALNLASCRALSAVLPGRQIRRPAFVTHDPVVLASCSRVARSACVQHAADAAQLDLRHESGGAGKTREPDFCRLRVVLRLGLLKELHTVPQRRVGADRQVSGDLAVGDPSSGLPRRRAPPIRRCP